MARSKKYRNPSPMNKDKMFNKPATQGVMEFAASSRVPVNAIVIDAEGCRTSHYLIKRGFKGKISAITNNPEDFKAMKRGKRHQRISCEEINGIKKYRGLKRGKYIVIDDGASTWRVTRERIAVLITRCTSLYLVTNCVPRGCHSGYEHEYEMIEDDMIEFGRENNMEVVRYRMEPYRQTSDSQLMYPDRWEFRPAAITIDFTE